MSDSATPAPVSDAASDRFSLIELDMPAPVMPDWALALLAVIAAILPREMGADVAFEALSRACTPLRSMPEWAALAPEFQAQVRAAKDAKLAEINALRSPAGSGVRQTLPVVVAPATAPVIEATLPPAVPVVGSWKKRDGEWCALMPSVQGTRAPRIGDVVCVEKRNGERVSHRVLKLVASVADGVLLQVQRTDAQLTYFVGATGPALVTDAPSAPHVPAAVAAMGWEPPTTAQLETMSLESALGAVSDESAANASAQGSGSLADGTMRGVGFSTAAGYVQALANGVKAATADSYKSTLRGSYGFTANQIAALTVTIIAETALPVGAGIVHMPTGPGIFDLPRDQRTFKVGASKSKADVRALLAERDFIAGAVAAGSMMQASWTGEGQSTCEAFNAKLAPLGMEDLAPSPPSAIRHAGDAVAALRGRDYDTTRLTSADLPDGINARWLVGRKLSGAAIKAGDAYGTALLVVSLHDDETISFDGDPTLAATVRATYTASTAKETLRSNTLTPWLAGLLRNRFRGVKRGHVWYVPAGCTDEARALIEAIAPLWGDHELMPVTTGKDLMRSLTRGLTDETAALTAELAKRTIEAQDNAEKKLAAQIDAGKIRGLITGTHGAADAIKLARARATVSATVANSIMGRLATVAARVDGYTAALGDDATVAVKAQIAALRATLEPLSDDAALRSAMLELT